MFSYSVVQWLFFFYFYCFFGWCFESAYVSIKERKLVNRGFMKGPFLPLYGSGGIVLLVVSKPFLAHWWTVYIAGCVGATILEYFTGVAMEALFKVRYWDYSSKKLNFQGQICLSSTLAWGGLTLLMAYVVHEPVERLVLAVPGTVLTVVTILLTVYIAADFALSFREAMDLRDILVAMEKAKAEIARMQRRVEIVAAIAEDSLNTKREALSESVSRKKDALFDTLRIENLKRGIAHRIRNNPTMVSQKYREVFEELKKKAAAIGRGVRGKKDDAPALRDGYESDDICAACGGMCCKNNGCSLSPEDMFYMMGQEGPVSQEEMEAWLVESPCAIDSFSLADGPFYFVRMRHKCFTFIGVDAMGECIALTEEGCRFSVEDRPKGGRYLEGKSDRNCVQHYAREDMIADWRPYQTALKRIWDKWYDKLMKDGTIDACEEAYMQYQREKMSGGN